MKEIIHIQVGQCGNEISSKFWDLICNEHGINDNGVRTSTEHSVKDNIEVYFREDTSGRFTPRAILTDLDPGVTSSIQASSKGELFCPANYIVDIAGGGAASNWARGHYSDGAQLIDALMDAIRKEVEECESLQGFQLAHSLGGGTGSGLGTLITTKLAEEYPGRIRQTFSVLPSLTAPEVVIAPYNCVLALNYMLKDCDLVNVFENGTLFDICNKDLGLESPTCQDVNRLISQAMSGITSSFRFQNQQNFDLGKLKTSLVPSPRLHFLTVSLAPLTAKVDSTLEEISHQLFDSKNLLCSVDPSKGKYFATSASYRCDSQVSIEEIEKQTRSSLDMNSKYFGNSISVSSCAVPLEKRKFSATLLGNTTAMGDLLKRAHVNFSAMWQKKAFGAFYMSEMDGSEMTEAESNILDLISEYEKYQDDDDWEKVL